MTPPAPTWPAGKTQALNYYLVNKAWYLVDCPGYG
jgi:GTP-binding protein EngB required for normal cell division